MRYKHLLTERILFLTLAGLLILAPIIDVYTDGEVKIDAPFLTWEKPAIYTYCIDKGIPIKLTYSCEAGTSPPCGKCTSCRDREALDVC